MGCGSSVAPAGYEPPPDPASENKKPEPKVEEVGGFTVTTQAVDPTDMKRPGGGAKLPFVRYDTSAVPKELCGGDHVYLQFTYSGLLLEGTADSPIKAEATEPGPSCLFRLDRKDATNSVFKDGDDVFLCHTETGLYLDAADDRNPVALTERSEDKPGQMFNLFKQGRPLNIKHRNTVYLQTWLCNFIEEHYFEGVDIYAKRWARREPNTLTILKKAVMESSTTELARKYQFQAFDLDGNKSISRAEMHQMVRMVKPDVTDEEIDEVMVKADPANTGNVPFASFASWADDGGLTEEQLQHIEVLGNIAQRCNDCLHEEDALIEVLTTVGMKTSQDILTKYEASAFGCLPDQIVQKASEQDGWIFTSYWKAAMQAMLEDEVDLWVRCLNDAMKGWGTDEGTLTALVCTIPERLRSQIFKKYAEKCGKNLLDHIKSETSCAYQKVLVWQAMDPEGCRATILNKAMAGLGTSEDQLIRVICALDFGQRRRVKEAYERMFCRDLVDHIKSETSGDFQKSLLCMLEAEESVFDLDADCAAMKEAMDGWGTDEAALVRLICSKTSKQMEEVNARFQELYDRDLLKFVESETSGHFKATLQGCIRHPSVQLAHSVRDCIAGYGTDDEGLITCLVHLEDFQKASLVKSYSKEFNGRDLMKDIKSDTSGDYETALCSLVKSAPTVWAEALTGAMKGLGTSDELLINFMVLAKDDMKEVRTAFYQLNGKLLEDWIDGDTSGDYKKTLMWLAARNSEDTIDLMPVYWSQRCHDAVRNIEALQDVLVSMPAVSIKRHTELYEHVYGKSLRDEIAQKCDEGSSWFSFSNYWKTAMLSLLDMPIDRYVKGLYDAMNGLGTDEFTLTGLVCTLPENLYDDIHKLYEEKYGKSLVDHIESETSFSYKKALKYQAMSWPESRAHALHGAMAGWGTAEDQLIRVIVCSTMEERVIIQQTYKRMFKRDLIDHVRSETSGPFKHCLVSLLKSTRAQINPNYDADCEKLKKAMDGIGTNEKSMIKVLARKTPEQMERLKARFQELYEEDLLEMFDGEWMDPGAHFRACVFGLLRKPIDRLAYSIRYCMEGFGTDDTGLITLLVHLSERKRRDLVEAFAGTKGGGDIYEWIKGDTSGNYKNALLSLVEPPPYVWAKALHGAMAGLGTSDNLLINWMCLAKDRMDEVREAFQELYEQPLAEWIDGDCSGDYKDTLIKLANRRCIKFSGQEVALTVPPPATREDALLKFTCSFNKLCRKRKSSDSNILPPEEEQQEMGSAFLYYGALSSCAPNIDKPGLWDLTNAVGFPPADAGPDLDATFREWNQSGTGEITWNDFVREMTTRINDPNHFNAEPLPESEEGLAALPPAVALQDAPQGQFDDDPPDSEDELGDGGNCGEDDGRNVDSSNFVDARGWRYRLQDEEPCEENGIIVGPWGDCMEEAVRAEHTEGFEGAPGHVIDFLSTLGHDSHLESMDRREQQEHEKY